MARMNISEAFMTCSGINSMSGNQYFHLLTTSKNFHQRQCSLMIIQKVAMANLRISLEIYFSMFYHFYHGLLYCSMDRHGCPDGWGRFSGRVRTVKATMKRNLIWFLSILNLGWASWIYNGILKERLILSVLKFWSVMTIKISTL